MLKKFGMYFLDD